MPTIAFTGHRPKDIPGKTYMEFAHALDALGFAERKDLVFITGGALGTDTWAARYALAHRIPYDVIIPFTPDTMGRYWSQAQRDVLRLHMENARHTEVLTTEGYDVEAYQRRNIRMVNLADVIVAVWTGKRYGGTANCIRYALGTGKKVYNLWPLDGKLHTIKEA